MCRIKKGSVGTLILHGKNVFPVLCSRSKDPCHVCAYSIPRILCLCKNLRNNIVVVNASTKIVEKDSRSSGRRIVMVKLQWWRDGPNSMHAKLQNTIHIRIIYHINKDASIVSRWKKMRSLEFMDVSVALEFSNY